MQNIPSVEKKIHSDHH